QDLANLISDARRVVDDQYFLSRETHSPQYGSTQYGITDFDENRKILVKWGRPLGFGDEVRHSCHNYPQRIHTAS
ncbi:MAG TPA: hypothetical protein VEX18_21845, partial [Polyangiaceae bacterium]|nr:hypothetical protein [Polyangiaceae bacterium]